MKGQRSGVGRLRSARWDRRGCAALLVAAVVGSGALVGDDSVRAAPTGSAADQTFTDRTGDSRGRLDLLSVRLTTSGGRLDIRLNVREKTLNANEDIGIQIFPEPAGTVTAYELQLNGGGSGELLVFRRTASGWGSAIRNAPGFSHAGFYDFGTTITAQLSALGNPSRFRFWAYVAETDESQVWDSLPDRDTLDFEVTAAPQPTPTPRPPVSRDFVSTGATMVPNPPRAGAAVRVGARFVYRGSGAVVQGGTVSCDGAVGSRSLVGRAARDGARRLCVFALPATAGGQLFRGRVTLTVGARTASVARTARVVSVSVLRLRGPTTFSPPAAGQAFPASFVVELVRPGVGAVRVTGGEVSCRATVEGRLLAVNYSGFDRGRSGWNAICNWQLPASARGSMLVGTIMVRSKGMNASSTFRRRVQ